jgi:hypothetical protein
MILIDFKKDKVNALILKKAQLFSSTKKKEKKTHCRRKVWVINILFCQTNSLIIVRNITLDAKFVKHTPNQWAHLSSTPCESKVMPNATKVIADKTMQNPNVTENIIQVRFNSKSVYQYVW